MNPSSIIMNNEIQEISGEEYKRNLEDARKVATHLAQAFQSMPLPRSLKIQATKLLEKCEEKKLVMNALEGENSPPPRSSILEDVRIENYCANDTSECLENHGGDNGESAIEEANPLNLTIQKPPPNKTSAPIAQQTSTSAQSSTKITQCSKIVASESILALNPHLTASSPPSNISANLVPPSTEENESECSYDSWIKTIAKLVWARVVAASIETVADKLNRPAEPATAVTKIDSLPAQIQMIQWLLEFKKSGNFGKGNKEWPNSMQVVKDFYNQIIDLMISFSIFQAQAHAKFKAVTKKKKSKKNTSSLTTDSKDYRNASISDCMDFINSASLIHLQDTQSKTSEEKIWKNVYTYIHQLLLPAFRHPDEIPKFQPPTIHQLAEAVATDFISHWTEISPDSTFVIPNKPSQITFE
ncbi:hypothetical protein BY996DRAFT_6412870 [Phakopsora pachyrhizi]|nr:hypothetical protein BY996DRAFT_6412870 [Phakopsora pachyrhizi]